MNEIKQIKEYLVSIGFRENDNGFLAHNIENVDLVLMHDPFSGYSLSYSEVNRRTAQLGEIVIGKTPKLVDMENALLKVYQ